MNFLLTSAGITNESIRKALVDLRGLLIETSKAVCIPTAIYALPGGYGYAWQVIAEQTIAIEYATAEKRFSIQVVRAKRG
ncbi:MAG: hypothetical protein E6J34_03090 [Chloroflexi bacterium]|nr:MAG: hypothetical protein E6J34_03090 [Chloroflexota bacterium]